MISANRRRIGSKSEIDWATTYFTFMALESGWFKNANRAMEYSLDKGKTWTTLAANTNSPTVSEGKYIMWRCTLNPGEQVGSFQSQRKFDVMGNAMSLIFGDNFQGKDDLTGYNSVLYKLFNDYTKVVSAENLYLPAMTLSESCYSRMFQNAFELIVPPKVLPATNLTKECYSLMFNRCSKLTTTPELMAETLADNCYGNMFDGCSSLTTVPELPNATLAKGCYHNMFSGCTNLTKAPKLQAMVLTEQCYTRMFKNCSKLAEAPELPATTLATWCYYCMFEGCSSLVAAPTKLPSTQMYQWCYASMFLSCINLERAPEIPNVTIFARNCFDSMFENCAKLNYIKAMFVSNPSNYTSSWVNGVSATGTFVKNSAATWDVSGVNGIPEGWTVQTASE